MPLEFGVELRGNDAHTIKGQGQRVPSPDPCPSSLPYASPGARIAQTHLTHPHAPLRPPAPTPRPRDSWETTGAPPRAPFRKPNRLPRTYRRLSRIADVRQHDMSEHLPWRFLNMNAACRTVMNMFPGAVVTVVHRIKGEQLSLALASEPAL